MSVLKGHMLSYLLQLLTLNYRQVENKKMIILFGLQFVSLVHTYRFNVYRFRKTYHILFL